MAYAAHADRLAELFHLVVAGDHNDVEQVVGQRRERALEHGNPRQRLHELVRAEAARETGGHDDAAHARNAAEAAEALVEVAPQVLGAGMLESLVTGKKVDRLRREAASSPAGAADGALRELEPEGRLGRLDQARRLRIGHTHRDGCRAQAPGLLDAVQKLAGAGAERPGSLVAKKICPQVRTQGVAPLLPAQAL